MAKKISRNEVVSNAVSTLSGKIEVKSNRWKIEQDGAYIRIYHMNQQCLGVDDAGFRQLTELIYKFLELKNNQ